MLFTEEVFLKLKLDNRSAEELAVEYADYHLDKTFIEILRGAHYTWKEAHRFWKNTREESYKQERATQALHRREQSMLDKLQRLIDAEERLNNIAQRKCGKTNIVKEGNVIQFPERKSNG